jgi:hypothetical protein
MASRRKRDQFCRASAKAFAVGAAPAIVDPHVVADSPAQLLQPLMESREARLSFRIIGGDIHEHADAPHTLGLQRIGGPWSLYQISRQVNWRSIGRMGPCLPADKPRRKAGPHRPRIRLTIRQRTRVLQQYPERGDLSGGSFM